MKRIGRPGALPLLAASASLLVPAAAGAQSQPLPANDLTPLLSIPGFPTPPPARVQRNPEPPLEPVPRAECGPGSRPLEGMQGRVPESAIESPQAAEGWTCNITPLGRHATPGGLRTWRYVDLAGRECAFYDASLSSPLNVVRLGLGPSPGVIVLDMSDPSRPRQTATLTELPMLSPHESLNLNPRRGLLAANMGNGTTLPGLMSVYDVSQDCRRPVLQATIPAARIGHESGFSPDGDTYWIAGGGSSIAAVDLSRPQRPRTLWEGNVFSHGLNVSPDGNRLYVADPINGQLAILDVSEIQARRSGPVVSEVSRLTWGPVTVPQHATPMEIGGRPYLLEMDEFGFRFTASVAPDTVGAARIIDISDEARPQIVSNIRLEVNQPEGRAAARDDPTPLPAAQFGYAGHYCAIPRPVDPEIVACSFINSGLRVFNIEDPLRPREVAYYIAPPQAAAAPGANPANFAMSQPAFAPERREVWYTDATSGFHALRLDPSVWPRSSGACVSRRRLTARIRLSRRTRARGVRSVRAYLDGRRVRAARRGQRIVVTVDLRGRRPGRARLVVRVRTRDGRTLTVRRSYRACPAGT